MTGHAEAGIPGRGGRATAVPWWAWVAAAVVVLAVLVAVSRPGPGTVAVSVSAASVSSVVFNGPPGQLSISGQVSGGYIQAGIRQDAASARTITARVDSGELALLPR